MKTLSASIVVIILALAVPGVIAAGSGLILVLEEPGQGETYSSIRNVRGWAVGPEPITGIRLFIDGAYFGDVPMGGFRADVGRAYPDYPASENAGFSMAFNYGNLEAGAHGFSIQALDVDGNPGPLTHVDFRTVRFFNSFLYKSLSQVGNVVDVSNALFSADADRLLISGMLAEGANYEMELAWKTAAQGFVISAIRKLDGTANPNPPRDPNAQRENCPSFVRLTLEEPIDGRTYSSVENIRGWAVASGGVDRIELYLDGEYLSNIPVGSRRKDVADFFEEDCPSAQNSGFSMAYYFSNLPRGEHEIEVRGYADTGAVGSARASFHVVNFQQGRFLDSATVIDLSAAWIHALDATTIAIDGMRVDDAYYRVVIQWTQATQGFSIIDILPLLDG